MKSPKDYVEEYQIDDTLFDRHERPIYLQGFIAEIQKDAYNQAIQDVEVNIECCMNLSEGFEYPTVKWDSISKLKIK